MSEEAKEHAYDSRAIANIFVDLAREAGYRLTTMSLVKYVYLAHGWNLGILGEPLIRHHVEAWKYGPVIPEVYIAFRRQGLNVTEYARDKRKAEYRANISPDDIGMVIVRKTHESYSQKSAFELSDLTHGANTPWSKYKGKRYSIIEDSDIRDHYVDLLRKLEEE